MHEIRTGVQQVLGARERVAALAFDHVTGQRERAAGKADQRHRAIEAAANLRHCVEDVAQSRHVGNLEGHDRAFVAQRRREPWAFAFGKSKPETHRVGNGQDIGEKDGRIEREASQRLQRDFRGKVRVLRKGHEASGPLARGRIFRQIAACLSHQPDRRVRRRQPGERPQEGVIFQDGHGATME